MRTILPLIAFTTLAMGCFELEADKGSTDTATDTASPDDTAADDTAAEDCETVEGVGCYWMENETGNNCWVAAPEGELSYDECKALDSCDAGGGGESGGCYKWSDGSDGEKTAWSCEFTEGEQCYWMENESGGNCWIPAPEGVLTFDECQALDACAEGGGGESGGGCYKWSDNSTAVGDPWSEAAGE